MKFIVVFTSFFFLFGAQSALAVDNNCASKVLSCTSKCRNKPSGPQDPKKRKKVTREECECLCLHRTCYKDAIPSYCPKPNLFVKAGVAEDVPDSNFGPGGPTDCDNAFADTIRESSSHEQMQTALEKLNKCLNEGGGASNSSKGSGPQKTLQ